MCWQQGVNCLGFDCGGKREVASLHLMVDIARWTAGVGCGGASHQRRAPVRQRVRDRYPLSPKDTRMTRSVLYSFWLYANSFFLVLDFGSDQVLQHGTFTVNLWNVQSSVTSLKLFLFMWLFSCSSLVAIGWLSCCVRSLLCLSCNFEGSFFFLSDDITCLSN